MKDLKNSFEEVDQIRSQKDPDLSTLAIIIFLRS